MTTLRKIRDWCMQPFRQLARIEEITTRIERSARDAGRTVSEQHRRTLPASSRRPPANVPSLRAAK